MNLEKDITNNIEISNTQNKFLNSTIFKAVNTGINIGLRALLPDVIEDQIISIKETLIHSGLKEGIKGAINETINFGKSIQGIINGNFENMEQINNVISKGGILDTLSQILDFTINKANEKNYLNNTVANIIKKGKNVILDNINDKIQQEMKNQTNYIEKLNKSIEMWKENYKRKDFVGMEKEYYNITEQLKKTIPIENVIKEARKAEMLHNLIKNNGQNFNLNEQEIEFVNNFA